MYRLHLIMYTNHKKLSFSIWPNSRVDPSPLKKNNKNNNKNKDSTKQARLKINKKRRFNNIVFRWANYSISKVYT